MRTIHIFNSFGRRRSKDAPSFQEFEHGTTSKPGPGAGYQYYDPDPDDPGSPLVRTPRGVVPPQYRNVPGGKFVDSNDAEASPKVKHDFPPYLHGQVDRRDARRRGSLDAGRVIRSWKSRGGKYWVKLFEEDDGSYSYRSDNSGGYMGKVSLEAALARARQEASYAPSKLVESQGDARRRTGDPLTSKGEKIMSSMQEQYGPKKGKSVFYASANKGTIKGVHGDGGSTSDCGPSCGCDSCRDHRRLSSWKPARDAAADLPVITPARVPWIG